MALIHLRLICQVVKVKPPRSHAGTGLAWDPPLATKVGPGGDNKDETWRKSRPGKADSRSMGSGGPFEWKLAIQDRSWDSAAGISGIARAKGRRGASLTRHLRKGPGLEISRSPKKEGQKNMVNGPKCNSMKNQRPKTTIHLSTSSSSSGNTRPLAELKLRLAFCGASACKRIITEHPASVAFSILQNCKQALFKLSFCRRNSYSQPIVHRSPPKMHSRKGRRVRGNCTTVAEKDYRYSRVAAVCERVLEYLPTTATARMSQGRLPLWREGGRGWRPTLSAGPPLAPFHLATPDDRRRVDWTAKGDFGYHLTFCASAFYAAGQCPIIPWAASITVPYIESHAPSGGPKQRTGDPRAGTTPHVLDIEPHHSHGRKNPLFRRQRQGPRQPSGTRTCRARSCATPTEVEGTPTYNVRLSESRVSSLNSGEQVFKQAVVESSSQFHPPHRAGTRQEENLWLWRDESTQRNPRNASDVRNRTNVTNVWFRVPQPASLFFLPFENGKEKSGIHIEMGLRAPYCVHPEAVTKFKTILLRIQSAKFRATPPPLDPRSSLRHGEAGSWICKRLGSQAHCPKCAREKKDFWVVNMAACETYLVACSSSLLFSYFSSSFSLSCSKLVSLSTFFSKETIQTKPSLLRSKPNLVSTTKHTKTYKPNSPEISHDRLANTTPKITLNLQRIDLLIPQKNELSETKLFFQSSHIHD
ncbi:uncharacterized protein CLUP02_05808 [Colletotrichum lupini]|uniref:Uncharacterized protein n=1 Tax=Colletotrichum lupini TaxID=145971 RepID=A0A9Q8SN96_9PEZI|nr:uncharacterized protein CLUP02_05808 [Colletotrichum lupini]UQC80325.1 hypothetical protein CLUP02_05808 [Colletotrichum lupini]